MSRKYNAKHSNRNKFRKHSYADKLEGRRAQENGVQKMRYQKEAK